ncbi:response regulator transcription factor [Adhaeribacter rhizoryzae]|uniref:response regulator transcription factor n=1 Tax=Adhaeribacter rhizoryzae TaxID=2607907 RepID=UPI001CC1D112|nr:response regulator transcription factor [Adhaeribacter rhizoryzae]
MAETMQEQDLIKVVLVDDHTIIRDGIKALLRESDGVSVVGEAGNGRELIDLLPTLEADVILMDINMPEMDGFEATSYIQERFPQVKVLVLSMLDHESYIAKVFDAGANGYLLKNTGREEMVCAIRIVAKGGRYLCSEIGFNLLNKLKSPSFKPAENTEEKQTRDLSQREIEILKLIADGLTNAEIADKIFTSKRTVETHRQNIIEKTKAKNTAALIKYAIGKGIIS